MFFTPSQYIKWLKPYIEELPADVHSAKLARMKQAANPVVRLDIPENIPAKYHERMQAAWNAVVAHIVFNKSGQNPSMMQRHEILRNMYKERERRGKR